MEWTKAELEQLRRNARGADELLNGCRNRLFVSDDYSEVMRLYVAAIDHLRVILKYAQARTDKD